MPQQINLCTPILLAQKRYFSAQTMVQALAVFLIAGGGLCAYWVWSLNAASAHFKTILESQTRDLEGMQVILQQSKTSAGPLNAGIAQELAGRQAELLRREKLLEELQQGLYQPGWGHSARLQLVAQTIPAAAWVTEVKADANQLEVSGYTLDPAVLNDWVARLAASPLLKGQQLSAVKVENTNADTKRSALEGRAGASLPAVPSAASSAVAGASHPMWSFHLVSSLARPLVPAGSKP